MRRRHAFGKFNRWFDKECAAGVLTAGTIRLGRRIALAVDGLRMNKHVADRRLMKRLSLPDVRRFKDSYRADRSVL